MDTRELILFIPTRGVKMKNMTWDQGVTLVIVIKMKEAERQKLQVLRLPYTTTFEMIIWVLPQSPISGILHTLINTPIINENSVHKISSQPGEYNNSPMFHKKSISIQVTTTIRIVITVA